MQASLPQEPDVPGLILVAEYPNNTGTSGTVSMEYVLTEVYCCLAVRGLAAGPFNYVQCDSECNFDHMWPRIDYAICQELRWSPLKWPGAKPRSREAFVGAFGPVAQSMLAALEA